MTARPAFELRQLTPDDWAAFRELRRLALTESPEAFGSTLAEWDGPGDTEERWRARLATVPFNVHALIDGSAAGQVSAYVTDEPHVVELISMYVHPDVRGAGVGELLVTAVCDWAAASGAHTVVLGVRSTNHHARRLYERCGFAVDSRPRGDCDTSMSRPVG